MDDRELKERRIIDLAGIILLLTGAGILIRTACFAVSQDIWFDELFTVELALKPVGELISLAARDVHPPLYYLIVKLVYIILRPAGVGIVTAAKLSSVIPYFIFIAYAATFIRRRYGWLGAGLSVFMIEAMPQTSAFMIEARMYSWAALCVEAMYLHAETALSIIKNDGVSFNIIIPHNNDEVDITSNSSSPFLHLTAVLIYGICAMYLHYYAAIAAVIIVALMLVRIFHRAAGIRRAIIPYVSACVIIAILAYLPWLGSMLGQAGAVRTNYWIQPLTWRIFPGCVKYVFMPNFTSGNVNAAVAVITFLAYAALLVRQALDYRNGYADDAPFACGTFLVFAGTALVGIVASFVIRPVFTYRYLMPVTFLFWMGFACMVTNVISNQSEPQIYRLLSAAVAIGLFISGVRCFDMFRGSEQIRQDGMDRTLDVFSAISDVYSEKKIICNFNQIQSLTWYYQDCDSILWGETDETLIAEICGRSPVVMTTDADELASIIRADGGDSFIYYGSFNARDEIIAEWKSRGFKCRLLYDSVLLERYYFNVYEIRID